MGDSIRTKDKLTELGFEVFIEPMFEIEYLNVGAVCSLNKYDVIAVTSRYGVQALSMLTDTRSANIIAVGDSTKAHAEDLGFKNVTSVSGVATDLSRHIRLHARYAKVLYVRGVDVSHDLAGDVKNSGVEIEELAVYRTVVSSSLSAEFINLLVAGKISGILFHSKGAARTFIDLSSRYGAYFKNVCAYTLSEGSVEILQKYTWYDIYVSGLPSEHALFQLLLDKKSG